MAAKRSLARVAGLDVDVLSRLEGHNFRTAEDVLTRSSLDLVELLDVSLPTAERVVASVAKCVCPKPQTAMALLRQRGGGGGGGGTARSSSGARASASGDGGGGGGASWPAFLPTHLAALDLALKGGVPTGSISELVGPAGAGKTQFCLTLAVAAAAPKSVGGLDGGVVFIDTEQKFSGVRLAEIARAKFPSVYGDGDGDGAPSEADARASLTTLTSRVLVLTPSTLSEILQRLNGLEEALIDHGVRLLVVDSMAALARAEFGRGQLQQRQELLGQIASVLKQQAERLHLAVFVTNQVTTRIGAAAGHDTGPGAGREEEDGGGIGGGGAERDAGSRDAGSRDAGSVTAALGTKWAHCVNTRLVLEGAAGGGNADAAGGGARVVKVVKSPRCALAGFEYEVRAGGVVVNGDRAVRVDASGSNVHASIRGVFAGSAL
jgi:RAD51-like protein 1